MNTARDSGVTPLYIAARQGHLECLELLVAAGASVNATKDRKEVGASPVYVASLEGHHECVQQLIEAGANTHLRAANGKLPSDVAKSDEMRVLLGGGALKGHKALVAADYATLSTLLAGGTMVSKEIVSSLPPMT